MFAECYVFNKQSQPPGHCNPLQLREQVASPNEGTPSPEVTVLFCLVPSPEFSQRLGILIQSTCVGFGYGLMWELFPGTLSRHPQSDKGIQLTASVTTHWCRNINLLPIDYAFLPRLRDRLTLRRLALRRKPWAFGVGASHPHYRYSCQHSHF